MMHEKYNEELGAQEKAQFASLRRELSPKASLEDRVVQTLKARGLIRMAPSTRRWPIPRFAGAMAAAVGLLIIGFVLGKEQSLPHQPKPGNALFVLLLFDSSRETSEDESGKVVEYAGWARVVRKSNRFITGEKLKESGRILRKVAGQIEVLQTTSAQEQNMLGGYFLIEAQNYDEAIQIASGCPHLKYGGVIELREIDQI